MKKRKRGHSQEESFACLFRGTSTPQKTDRRVGEEVPFTEQKGKASSQLRRELGRV